MPILRPRDDGGYRYRVNSALRQAVGAVEDDLRRKAGESVLPFNASALRASLGGVTADAAGHNLAHGLRELHEPPVGWTVVVTRPSGKTTVYDRHEDGWRQRDDTETSPVGQQWPCPDRTESGPFAWSYIVARGDKPGTGWRTFKDWNPHGCDHEEVDAVRSIALCSAEEERIPTRPVRGRDFRADGERWCASCYHRTRIHDDGQCSECPCFRADLNPHPTLKPSPTWRGPHYDDNRALDADRLVGRPVQVHPAGDLDLHDLYGNVAVTGLGEDPARAVVVARESIDWPEKEYA